MIERIIKYWFMTGKTKIALVFKFKKNDGIIWVRLSQTCKMKPLAPNFTIPVGLY